jgi:hypothetical protein
MNATSGTTHQTTRINGSSRTHRLAFWVGTALVALFGSTIGIFLVLPLGLVVSEYVIFPLALGVATILGSLGAGWAGNWLAPNHTRTQLLRVVGVTEVVAAIVAVVVLANAALRLVLLGPLLYVGLSCILVLALAATIATWRFRSRERASRDGLLTLGLLVLAVVSVPVTIFLAWLAGLTGA